MSNIIILAAIILYLGMVVWIGVICSKKNSDVGDFYLGGRKLGPVVTAMSAEASDMSSYLLMGVPGLAYLTGLADATWTAIGLALGTYLNWLIVAKKIRLYSHGYQAITLPDYFSKRFGDDKHVITLISAALIVIFFIPYTASGFAACGKLFNSLLGFDYHAAMIVSAVVIVLYCTMGGFLAASTSDLVQSIIMTFALAVVVIFGIVQAGGMGVVLDNAKALPGYLDMFHTHIAETNTSGDYGFFKIVSTLAWGLGYFGMPHILLRFMAIEDENKLKISRRIATVWVFISLIVATGIGVIGLTLSKSGIIDTLTGSESETIIVKISHYLSTFNPVAAFIAGIILAGILAATMSTADSQLLAAASGISQNLVRECMGVKLSEKAALIVARITVVIISIVAVFMAGNPDSSVFEIVSFAWAGFGATFGPVVLLSLFWRRANKYGAISGMISGGIMIFLWKYVISGFGGVFAIYELLPAFIVAIIVNVVVSLLTKAPSKEVLDKYDEVRAIEINA